MKKSYISVGIKMLKKLKNTKYFPWNHYKFFWKLLKVVRITTENLLIYHSIQSNDYLWFLILCGKQQEAITKKFIQSKENVIKILHTDEHTDIAYNFFFLDFRHIQQL